jgi:hypothetical protein
METQKWSTTRRLPLRELLEDLTWISDPKSSDVPPLLHALHRNILGKDYDLEILEYLVGKSLALISSRDQEGSLPLHIACRRRFFHYCSIFGESL